MGVPHGVHLVLAALCVVAGLDVPARSGDLAVLPLEARHDHLIVVRGAVGGLQGLRLAIDTGATQTIVDVAIAERLGLRRERARILNIDRWLAVGRGEVGPLEVGPVVVPRLPVLVARLTDASSLADGIDAIVGLDVLRRAGRIQIDYERRTLDFTLPSSATAPSRQPQILTVRLIVQGKPVVVVLDTGVQDLLLYGDRIRRHVGGLSLVDAVAGVREGRLEGVRATLRDVMVGPDRRDSPVFVVREAPRPLDPAIDGYVGPTALSMRLIELDLSANLLRWR